MASNDFRRELYRLTGGHNDELPPYGIDPHQCAVMKNWRVWQGEARTCKGYLSSTSSVIRSGVTSVYGLGYAIRADDTKDLIGASDGGYWRIVGDAKTLISTSRSRGLITAVSGTAVTGDADCRFHADYAAGDLFWMTTDGIAEAKSVVTVDGASAMTIGGYAGATTAGNHDGWWKVTDARTQMAFWNDKWFFANKADKLHQWDGTIFRETGMARPTSLMTMTSSVGGGALSATAWYHYRWALADSVSAVGLPQAGNADIVEVPASGSSIQFYSQDILQGAGSAASAFEAVYRTGGRFPTDCADIWVFRSGPHTTEAEAATAAQTYVTSFAASVSAWLDDGSITPATSAAPAYNFEPDAGYEDLAVVQNRLAAISGRELFISGLPPTDAYTDTAGRNEPEYWSVVHRIGDGEETGQYSFLSMRTRDYILGSKHLHLIDIRADDPAVWGVVPFLKNYGCVSRWSIANGGDMAFWMGKKAGRLTVLGFDGFSAPVDIGKPVAGILATVDKTKYVECVGGVGHGFYWLTVPITGGTYKTLEYNIRAGTWCWRDWQMQAVAQAEDQVYGAFEDGLVKQLETGYSKAGSAQTFQLDTAAVGGAPEWPNHFQSAQAEFDLYAGSPEVSAYYIVDEGTPAALPGSPIAVSAVPQYRSHQQVSAYGQREQLRFLCTGTDLDFALRGAVVKGQVDPKDAD